MNMGDYSMTAGDLETGLGERTVVVVEKKSSLSWRWKVCLVVQLSAICIAGALFYVMYISGRPDAKAEEVACKTEALIKNTDEVADPHHRLRRIVGKPKAAIHLESSYEDGSSQVEWRKDQGQGFAQGGFRLEHNQIVIPRTGLYFVYSQASFKVLCFDGDAGSQGKHVGPLSHRIWRQSDSIGSRASLMSAVRSACQRAEQGEGSVGEGWYDAIYLGAVFHLNKEDTLWTETNLLTELESEGGKTYFGVFSV